MKLKDTLVLFAESAIAPTSRHHAVVSPHMRKSGGFRPHVGREHVGHSGGGNKLAHKTTKITRGKTLSIKRPHVRLVHLRQPIHSDSSSSDLASHHTWEEPSASDVRIKNWREQRKLEKQKGRHLELYEDRPVTGPGG